MRAVKRWVVRAATTGVAVVSVTSLPARAQEPPAPPVVQIDSVEPAATTYRCGDIDPTFYPGSVTAVRTGDTSDALTVAYEVSGPAQLFPETFSFAAGSALATIDLLTPYGSDPPIQVTLLDGDLYDLGESASAVLPVDTSGVETDCPPYQPPEVEPRFTG